MEEGPHVAHPMIVEGDPFSTAGSLLYIAEEENPLEPRRHDACYICSVCKIQRYLNMPFGSGIPKFNPGSGHT